MLMLVLETMFCHMQAVSIESFIHVLSLLCVGKYCLYRRTVSLRSPIQSDHLLSLYSRVMTNKMLELRIVLTYSCSAGLVPIAIALKNTLC